MSRASSSSWLLLSGEATDGADFNGNSVPAFLERSDELRFSVLVTEATVARRRMLARSTAKDWAAYRASIRFLGALMSLANFLAFWLVLFLGDDGVNRRLGLVSGRLSWSRLENNEFPLSSRFISCRSYAFLVTKFSPMEENLTFFILGLLMLELSSGVAGIALCILLD